MREEKKRLIGNEKGRKERTEKGKQSENNVSNENEIHRCSTGLELQSFAIYQIYFDRASMRHLSKFIDRLQEQMLRRRGVSSMAFFSINLHRRIVFLFSIFAGFSVLNPRESFVQMHIEIKI